MPCLGAWSYYMFQYLTNTIYTTYQLKSIFCQCLVGYLRETQHRCPICKVELTEQEVNNCCLFWDNSSFKIDIESLAQARAELSGPNDANSGVFFIVLLNEKKITLKLSKITTVKALKYAIKDASNIDIAKQKLIYNDMELNRSPTIGHFRKPSFKLYDIANPNRQLCNYSIEQAKNSQAIIMCLINRSKNGMWHVIKVGETSSGNAKDYSPIEKNIR
ncbi:33155_t:CDS:2 [Gigaspora margarita]|uniref:33155_t:CDS:1 n=1 Tax=Gigaspora margarita TaxID=4874 RepID=A0ABN7VXS1_GIGMA|nr:33155_t:CDS:2 [Gigaspora margarita]